MVALALAGYRAPERLVMYAKSTRLGKTFPPVGIVLAMLAVGAGSAYSQVQVALSPGKSAALSPVSAAEQSESSPDGVIQGPVLGYFFDPSRGSLHPIRGIPGSSYVADPMPLGFSVKIAAVSPLHNYMLAVDNVSGEVKVVDVTVVPPAAIPIPGAGRADRIVLSPRGDAAALYDRAQRTIQFVSGLPANPSVEGSVDLSSLDGVITAIAISDDGEVGLVATSGRNSGSVYVLKTGQDPRPIVSVGRVLALAFVERSHDAVIADYDKNEVLLVQQVDGSAQPVPLASGNDGIVHPNAIIATADGRRALVASSDSRRVAFVPLSGGPTEFVSCRCEPTTLARLNGNSMFQLTTASGQPLFVLDASRAEARILFVPPHQPAEPSRSPAPRRAPRAARTAR
jgi:hypothetical protein